MKKILLLFTFLLSVTTIQAQSENDNIDTVILTEADKMGKAFVAAEYAVFAKFTHPTIVTMMGGEEKMISEIARSFDLIKEDGVSFEDISYGVPSEIIQYEGQLQCTLPQMIEMKVDGGTVTANAVLIAVSMDNGVNWYFIDPTGNDIATMRKIIPTLSPLLKIPVSVEPTYSKDK
ncbi:hypothetical protein DVK85_11965 [Flavobacterium arcticum]|uniref:Nuclear transport factor 2 family protein n=1 Tax=Flavobacterium arcticum TaxID=1784713 RepID=A0A345HE93_9FLAO|nr:hypothetical protein [Flavobacterium arcticum]AXG74903.1 hypothetical protein DVK85_11965 [Flavobacterium arcticum]KAF2509599.1 hypothetical protein E0W72_08715 [Flavobacterium arcticum]